jgi:Hsp70 protein
MPLAARLVETLFGQPPHLKVNPDEVVALGASIQAHALNRSKGGPKRKSAQDQLASAQGSPAAGDNVASRPAAPLPSGMQQINTPLRSACQPSAWSASSRALALSSEGSSSIARFKSIIARFKSPCCLAISPRY